MTNGVAVIKTTHYTYRLKAGGTVTKTRTDYADGSKSFKWPTGTKMSDVALYRGEDLSDLSPEEPWVLVEGEKTTDALRARGIVAVCLPGGSGQSDLSALDELAQYPENPGHISPDNDAVGLKAGAAWSEHLKRIHPKVRWVPPVMETPGSDFADLLADFSTDDDAEARFEILSRLEKALDGPPQPTVAEVPAKAVGPRLYAATDLVAMELEPVPEPVPGLFLAGHTLLSGAPKMGKSFLLESIAVGKAGGRPVLGKIIPDAGPVLWMPLEDGLRRTVGRLKQYLGDFPAPENLTLAFDWPGLNEGGLEYIKVWLGDHERGTVLIDTGKRLWNADDEPRGNGSMADYNFIGPLTDLYRDHDAFGVTVWHDRKMIAADFFDQISATRGLTANVDGVANLSRERGSKDGKLSIGHRDGEDKAFSLHWDDFIFNWVLVEQVDVANSKSNPRVRVLMALRKLDSETGVDPTLVQTEIGDMSLATVRNHLTELRKEGAAITVGRGKWRPAPVDGDDDE